MKRSIRLQYNAPVTLTFFFLSLASLVLGCLTNNWTTSHLFSVYRSSMTDPLFYVRLFGHVLGHGGWNHFINNMLLSFCELIMGGKNGLEAVEKYGAIKGGTLALWRIIRCNPFSKGGYDPVP